MKIANFGSLIGVSSCENVYILNKVNVTVRVLKVPPKKGILKESKNGEKEETREDNIVCLVFSPNGQYLAAATQGKKLVIWEVASWTLLKQKFVWKRPMALRFTPDASRIIVADKNGDVYAFPVSEEDDSPKDPEPQLDSSDGPDPLLGHLSMLFDLVITDDGKFIITSDRDEKIRVSCYPNCYSIHTFCLGHLEFVSHVRILPRRPARLLSASGDGTVKLWNYLTGNCLGTLDIRLQIQAFHEYHEQDPMHRSRKGEDYSHSTFISQIQVHPSGESTLLALCLYKLPLLLFYAIRDSDQLVFLLSYETDAPLLDFVFHEEREILAFLDISSDDPRNPLAIFKLAQDFSSVVQVDDHPVLKFGRDYRIRLKGVDMWSLDAGALYKHRYDNVSEYQKKKQERLSNTQVVLPTKRKVSE